MDIHYSRLGIDLTYDVKIIRNAYLLAMKENHPDKNNNTIDSNSKTILLKESYEQIVEFLKRSYKVNFTPDLYSNDELASILSELDNGRYDIKISKIYKNPDGYMCGSIEHRDLIVLLIKLMLISK